MINSFELETMLKEYGLIKKINHVTATITIRRSHKFTDVEKTIIHNSHYTIKIEQS